MSMGYSWRGSTTGLMADDLMVYYCDFFGANRLRLFMMNVFIIYLVDYKGQVRIPRGLHGG